MVITTPSTTHTPVHSPSAPPDASATRNSVLPLSYKNLCKLTFQ